MPAVPVPTSTSGSTEAEPALPGDTPLLDVLRGFEARGYGGQFRLEADQRGAATVRCLTCNATTGVISVAASSASAPELVRLEGASDPADMLAVVALACQACGALGTLVCNYGPESSPEEAELLRTLERSPEAAAVRPVSPS